MYEFLLFRTGVLAIMRANKHLTVIEATAVISCEVYELREYVPEAKDEQAAEAWSHKWYSDYPDCDEIPF